MEVLCRIARVWSSQEYVCCAYEPSENIDRFCLYLVMSEVISLFRILRAGAQVFVFLMLFLYVILHTMWSGKSSQLLCILPFGILCLSAIRMMFMKKTKKNGTSTHLLDGYISANQILFLHS